MDWDSILTLREWTPLSEIGEAEPVMNGVYKVGQHAYLRTQPYNSKLELGDALAPFVTMAYWSPSVNGVKRLVLGDPSIRIEEPLPEPPPELGLDTSGLYSELARLIPLIGATAAERAVYSNKGIFLARSIRLGPLEYCFLGRGEMDERAFAIKLSLVRTSSKVQQLNS